MSSVQSVPDRFAEALRRLNGDVELLRDMAAIMSADLPTVKSQTDEVVAKGDCRASAASLHKLKGMLSTFESDGVVLDIQDVLALARQSKVQQMQDSYLQHCDRIDDLIRDITSLRLSLDDQSG